MSIALVIHGHFYQPPRENPWSDDVEREPSAAPSHDWNARIHAECYRANAFARIHERSGRIQSIVNNYGRLSFNFGPTLARWIERHDAPAHRRLIAADDDQRRRLGAGGAVAQAYAHPILPLATPHDRRTQVLWGLADFRRRFGRPADGFWLPETAANADALETLIDLGVDYTILAPEQVAAVRGPGEEWTSVDRDTVDTGRAYRWVHRDGSGRFLNVAVFDGPLSRGVAFGDATRDAATFLALARASAKRSRVSGRPLVLCASDGELFGHHKKFADLNLAFTTFVEGPRAGIEPTNLGAYLRDHPATWEMALAEGPDGKGTSWSCAHGVGRWWRDCGCSMVAPEHGWNQRWRTPLRAALDRLQAAAATFFEDAAPEFLLDPWGARDAYGEVVDAPMAVRDAHVAAYATPALVAGGDDARAQVRLLMEMQRATLLMYSSCGWYFDDIAGLEASLILRLAAHAADLMTEAGGHAPTGDLLDILADAKSNQTHGQTGADVFRQVAGDRTTPARAVASVALVAAATPGVRGAAPVGSADGYAVELLGVDEGSAGAAARPVDLGGDRWRVSSGQARATGDRTGRPSTMSFRVLWDAKRGFQVFVDDAEVTLGELGRESRSRLLPLLFPRLLEQAVPSSAARMALQLGADVVGSGDVPDDVTARQGYARLLFRLLSAEAVFSVSTVDIALGLFDAAGSAMAAGTPERGRVEERVAELLATASGSTDLRRLAHRLGFADETTAGGGADAEIVARATPSA